MSTAETLAWGAGLVALIVTVIAAINMLLDIDPDRTVQRIYAGGALLCVLLFAASLGCVLAGA